MFIWYDPFIDENYICSSTYGNPRSKDFHHKKFKELLIETNLPEIRFHDLRSTFCTILIKNEFNLKAVSKMMRHALEIISVDLYTDKKELLTDYSEDIQGFIDKVTPIHNELEDDVSADLTKDFDLNNVINIINKFHKI